jgi:hypothetical protein
MGAVPDQTSLAILHVTRDRTTGNRSDLGGKIMGVTHGVPVKTADRNRAGRRIVGKTIALGGRAPCGSPMGIGDFNTDGRIADRRILSHFSR